MDLDASFEWAWVALGDLAKYSTIRNVARCLCDSWASCWSRVSMCCLFVHPVCLSVGRSSVWKQEILMFLRINGPNYGKWHAYEKKKKNGPKERSYHMHICLTLDFIFTTGGATACEVVLLPVLSVICGYVCQHDSLNLPPFEIPSWIFIARQHTDAERYWYTVAILSVRLSVCLSVRRSCSGILSKILDILS